ncbi:MAG: response regulator [Acidobacteria bacterium]|nr:response regulator [Acidobacteriota bacterium]
MSFKILIVEDNKDTRELLHMYFTNAGFTVAMASDGGEGLYMAEAEKPDLIITDLSMPNIDGTEMIKQLRADSETAHIPILVFTAHGSATTDAAMEVGADQAFYKPFDFDELVNIVREMLQKANCKATNGQAAPNGETP